ncbi:hypothetical protein HRI_000146900 [Hibiscus trionum]|uniref:Uncharacterized protein n=1 Tax=Hibiscus trionum TaxID=183268 RepID=A0A9W7LHV8_HIBTR|nr:hypothetical protein HRI_000146900 [Hibiscus trionum]
MPNGNKNQAVDHIKERFSLEVSDDYVKHALGKKWRDHKSFLKKKYFKNSLSLQEKMQNVPPGLLRYQWEDAVRFWSSTKGEERERVGVASRQKQKYTHTAGSKSFARIANEEELKSGSSVGRVQLFDITHTKKDGSAITPEAAEIMAKMKDKKIEFEATASTNARLSMLTQTAGPVATAQNVGCLNLAAGARPLAGFGVCSEWVAFDCDFRPASS